MLTNCAKCRKKIENLDSKIFKTKNGRIIIESKCSTRGIKKPRFIKALLIEGLLSSLALKSPLNKTLLLGDIFF